MNTKPVAPLETLFDAGRGNLVPMPPEIAVLYGTLQLPSSSTAPIVISNFVETIDGIVSLGIPGHSGGNEISGNSQPDRALMGILRGLADAVVVGAGTLRAVPNHLWTAEYIFPPLADAFRAFRSMLHISDKPLNVIVSSSGDLDLSLPVFASGLVQTLIVTGSRGEKELSKHELPTSVTLQVVPSEGKLTARQVLDAIAKVRRCRVILVEGGPQLLGDFFEGGLVDELFLTLAPQIAGTNDANPRPTLVQGQIFAPERPLWGDLSSVRRSGSHLFLRYSFDNKKGAISGP